MISGWVPSSLRGSAVVLLGSPEELLWIQEIHRKMIQNRDPRVFKLLSVRTQKHMQAF